MIFEGSPYCIIAGVDTFIVSSTLAAYQSNHRLLTEKNSDGFIPGEAGGAILLGPTAEDNDNQLRCLGIGYGSEPSTIDSEKPLRGNGLTEAIGLALSKSGLDFNQLDYRITDLNGEQYKFREATLGELRLLRNRSAFQDLWHPIDCFGEIGAAIVPCCCSVALNALEKGYAPGPNVLCHFSDDSCERAAFVLSSEQEES